mgnify:CR=1 FL=1
MKFNISLKSIIYSVIVLIVLIVGFIVTNYLLDMIGMTYAKWEIPSIALSLLFIMLGCIAEEIGWRGFS